MLSCSILEMQQILWQTVWRYLSCGTCKFQARVYACSSPWFLKNMHGRYLCSLQFWQSYWAIILLLLCLHFCKDSEFAGDFVYNISCNLIFAWPVANCPTSSHWEIFARFGSYFGAGLVTFCLFNPQNLHRFTLCDSNCGRLSQLGFPATKPVFLWSLTLQSLGILSRLVVLCYFKVCWLFTWFSTRVRNYFGNYIIFFYLVIILFSMVSIGGEDVSLTLQRR